MCGIVATMCGSVKAVYHRSLHSIYREPNEALDETLNSCGVAIGVSRVASKGNSLPWRAINTNRLN